MITDYRIVELLKDIKALLLNINHTVPDEWMSLKEVANYTSLSPTTIRRLIDRGELKVSRSLPKKLMFRKEWIDRYMEGKCG